METADTQVWLTSRDSITDAEQYIKNNHSRRSVDWRDSGIVIDDDFNINNLELPHYDIGLPCPSNQSSVMKSSGSSNYDNQINQADSSNYNPIEDDDGDTILHLAVVGCTQTKVLELMKICDLNAINNLMHTPLHVATMGNRPEMVKLLLDNKAKLDVPDRRGNTPLHLACKSGHIEIVNLMLEAAKIMHPDQDTNEITKQYIEITNFDGLTCLHLASSNDHRDIIDLLVKQHNCNINCQDSRSGETILHKAIHQLNIGLIKYILELEKHCNEKDYYGRSPMATIDVLIKSNIPQQQVDILESVKELIRNRIIKCIEQRGCCLFLMDCQDEDMSSDESSSGSEYTDSD